MFLRALGEAQCSTQSGFGLGHQDGLGLRAVVAGRNAGQKDLGEGWAILVPGGLALGEQMVQDVGENRAMLCEGRIYMREERNLWLASKCFEVFRVFQTSTLIYLQFYLLRTEEADDQSKKK